MSNNDGKKIILITGANSGIGLTAARFIARASSDYHVIVGSRSLRNGEEAVKDIQSGNPAGSLSVLEIDITNDDSIAAAADKVGKEHGRLDVLVNNAGVCTLEGTLAEKLRRDIGTNAIGSALVTQAFEPLLLKASSPRLLYVSSILGSIDTKLSKSFAANGIEAYCMSKAALNMLVACDQVRLGDRIKISVLCPGYVRSNLGGKDEAVQAKRNASGAGSNEPSAQLILDTIDGKKDEFLGGFFDRNGRISW